MIDYFKRGIEFCVYDRPFKNYGLTGYKIRGVLITHSQTEIKIKFPIQELIIGFGIFVNKFDCIYDVYKRDLSIFLENNNSLLKIEFDRVWETLLTMEGEVTIIIKSSGYDLLNEEGIIVYYNLNDEYEDEVLEEILKQWGDPFDRYGSYIHYRDSRPYTIGMFEICRRGPQKRFWDGVVLSFAETPYSLKISFPERATFEAITLFELIVANEVLEFDKIEINEKPLDLPLPLTTIYLSEKVRTEISDEKREEGLKKIISDSLDSIKEANDITIYFKERIDWTYLLGIAFYKIYPDLPEDYYLDKELETWDL